MQQPPGVSSKDHILVHKLHKVMYGLKQTPRSWFQKLTNTLRQLGFTAIKGDTFLFVKFTQSYTIFNLIYVDDHNYRFINSSH